MHCLCVNMASQTCHSYNMLKILPYLEPYTLLHQYFFYIYFSIFTNKYISKRNFISIDSWKTRLQASQHDIFSLSTSLPPSLHPSLYPFFPPVFPLFLKGYCQGLESVDQIIALHWILLLSGIRMHEETSSLGEVGSLWLVGCLRSICGFI